MNLANTDSKALLPKHTMLRVSGRLFYPVTAQIIYRPGDTPQPIWSFLHQHLSLTLSRACEDMQPELDSISDRVQALPSITGPHSHILPCHLLGNNDEISLYIPRDNIPVIVQVVKPKGLDGCEILQDMSPGLLNQ